MLSFRTKGFNGSSVKYSPFYDNKIAVASSANYGLVGNGRLYVLSINADGSVVNDVSFDTQDGLFDVAWSEEHENHVATASGDGSIKIFDITVGQFPVAQMKEHTREVMSLNWNMVEKNLFTSSSWDGTIKIWSATRRQSLLTLNAIKPGAKSQCVYQASFSPHNANTLLSAHSSSHATLWDTRLPNPKALEWIAHQGTETLCCDWNKYRPTVVATAGVDKVIRVWDLRMGSGQGGGHALPLSEFAGHEFAVKRVVWSPHEATELLSCSYDMTARVWRDEPGSRFQRPRARVFSRHREFVQGADYSLWGQPGWVATVGWDEMVYIWDSKRI